MNSHPANDGLIRPEIAAEAIALAPAQPPANFCVCPVCGGPLIEIRHKRHCQQCHAIVETCCEGARG